MAKIDVSTLECHNRPTELSAIIKNVENAIRPKLNPGIVLNYMLGAPEYTIDTDPDRLTQVLINLLSNACKYTTKGAITYGYEIYDEEVYFNVKDTGAGVAPDLKAELEDLFEGGEYNRIGMGLPISHAIVTALGGQMGLESRGIGRGCNFWFTLPNTASEVQDGIYDDAISNNNGAHDLTILVAEDNESNFLLFQSILEQQYNVVRAHDGIEAIEQFKRTNPDLILMDINMPNLDGYGAVKEIRKISTTVPIIAVTAYAFVTDRQRILENGFNSYVSKPINVNRLEKEILSCLNQQ